MITTPQVNHSLLELILPSCWVFNGLSVIECNTNFAKLRRIWLRSQECSLCSHPSIYPHQLGTNHVCMILSHRRDNIMAVWYFVSHSHDTSFEASFRYRKKYLSDVFSLDPCNALCIHSKIPFQITFRAKKNYSFFKV